MKVERWVKITISVVPNNQQGKPDYQAHRGVAHSYDLPRELYDRRRWIVNWRHAKIQCMHPRNSIRVGYNYYDKKTGLELSYKSELSKLISTKGQITKIRNVLKAYEEKQSKFLFWEKEHDKRYQKTLNKLKSYEDKLNVLEKEVSELISKEI